MISVCVGDYLKVARQSCLYSHHVKLPVIIIGECKGRLSTVVRSVFTFKHLLCSTKYWYFKYLTPARQPVSHQSERERGGEIAKMLSMNIFHYLTLCNVEPGNILHDKLSKRSLILGPTLCHFSTYRSFTFFLLFYATKISWLVTLTHTESHWVTQLAGSLSLSECPADWAGQCTQCSSSN